MNHKYLFYFEVSKVIIAIPNLLFLVDSHTEVSLLISVLSLITSAVLGLGAIAVETIAVGALVLGLGAIAVGLGLGALPAEAIAVVLGLGAIAVGALAIVVGPKRSQKTSEGGKE